METSKLFMFFAIGVVILLLLFSNRGPNLTGMSVDEAKKHLELKFPKYKLRNKSGFVEPDVGKAFMLGKIATITVEPDQTTGEFNVDYVLYQIDTSKIATYSNEMNKILSSPNKDNLPKEMRQFSDLQSALQDLAKLDAEINAPQPTHAADCPNKNSCAAGTQGPQEAHAKKVEFDMTPQVKEYVPSPAEDQIQPEPPRPSYENRTIRIHPPRGLVDESSINAPKTSNNRLKMSVPDRASNSYSHFSKESFFW